MGEYICAQIVGWRADRCFTFGCVGQSGKVKKGDLITMISATFGDECWSARGAGLGMIMQAIKVRFKPPAMPFPAS